MKPLHLAAILAAFVLPLLTACADPSRSDDADDLRSQLAELPGVAKADLDYIEPVFLDSGKLELRVRMADDADPAAVVEVISTAYDAFADTHRGEEGDVFVAIGDDTIHLRSFEPEADVDAVQQATTHAIAVLPAGSVRVDIDTQDADKKPYVFTSYDVKIAEHDPDSVLQALTDLEQAHDDIPNAGWSVQTASRPGWQLKSSDGFPDSEQRALFEQLRGDLPKGASVLLADDFATAKVPARTTADEVSAMVGRHLALLGGAERAFYDVTRGAHFYLMVTVGDCTFASGDVGARLKKDHGAGCAEVVEVTA